jgi:ABC-type transporter Mla maintaining outer membrane lipid asymmetry ATPase subunit MlaF
LIRNGELLALGSPEDVRNSTNPEVQTFLNASYQPPEETAAT